MNSSDTTIERFAQTLERAAPDYQIQLTADALRHLSDYFALLSKWNERLHLTAPCSPEEFATRHVLESLMMIHYLPPESEVADIGSGAGLPLIPCLIVRPDITGTMIESSKKKAVFLKEALKETGTSARGKLITERFESSPHPTSGFVSCRAIERFQELMPALIDWAPKQGTLLLFGGTGLQTELDQHQLSYLSVRMPESARRFLFVVRLE